VPPNSFVVYRVHVLGVKSSLLSTTESFATVDTASEAENEPSGPVELLGTGVTSLRQQTISTPSSAGGSHVSPQYNKKGSKLLLVDGVSEQFATSVSLQSESTPAADAEKTQS